jgi:hypothetical protein
MEASRIAKEAKHSVDQADTPEPDLSLEPPHVQGAWQEGYRRDRDGLKGIYHEPWDLLPQARLRGSDPTSLNEMTWM